MQIKTIGAVYKKSFKLSIIRSKIPLKIKSSPEIIISLYSMFP